MSFALPDGWVVELIENCRAEERREMNQVETIPHSLQTADICCCDCIVS